MEKFIDLHMHSKYSSDGEFTPEELVKQCYQAGIRIMAIADHNSVKAIDPAKEMAEIFSIYLQLRLIVHIMESIYMF